MLGRDHALLGAVAYLGIAPLVVPHMPPAELATGSMVCAAFALLPDIDEPHSLVSTKLGPLSEAVSRVTNKLSGGHRHATHSALFVAIVGCLAVLSQHWRYSSVAFVVASGFMVLRIIVPFGLAKRGMLALLPIAAAGWWVWSVPTPRWWLPITAMSGVFLHLVGDMLTKEGVPLLWPQGTHLAVPILGHTDSAREQGLAAVMSVAIAVLAWLFVVIPAAHALTHGALSQDYASLREHLHSIMHWQFP